MIEINLLPEHLRRAEGTPLPRILTIYIGVAVCLGLIFLNYHFMVKSEQAAKKRDDLQARVNDLQQQIKELDRIEQEIMQVRTHVSAVEELYRERVVWAKLLWDLKTIVNNQEYNRKNANREYLWFYEMNVEESRSRQGQATTLELSGYASASGRTHEATVKTSRMIQEMVDEMRTYTPETGDGEEPLAELDEEHKERLEILRAKDPSELTEEERMELKAAEAYEEHLRLHRSGAVARKSFMSFFKPETVDYNLQWSDDFDAGGGRGAEPLDEPPTQAMGFTLSMELKGRQKQEETGF